MCSNLKPWTISEAIKLYNTDIQGDMNQGNRVSNQERIDIQNISGLDDQAPPGPDRTCGSEGNVLSH